MKINLDRAIARHDHFRSHRLPQGGAGEAAFVPVPLSRRRLRRRDDLGRQRSGPAQGHAAAARAERLGAARPVDRIFRREARPADLPRARRPDRHVRPARRGAGGEGGGLAQYPVHPVDGQRLPAERGGGPVAQPDLVPALRAEGPRLHGRRAATRQGFGRGHAGLHRRHAGAGIALSRRTFGHERAERRDAPHLAGHHPSGMGVGRRRDGPSARPRQYLGLSRRGDRA